MGAFNAGPILPNVNGRSSLAGQLWVPTDKLIVSPRHRLSNISGASTGAMAAGATGQANMNLGALETFQAGDGALFDLVLFTWVSSPAIQSVTLLNVQVIVTWQVGFGQSNLPTQPIITTNSFGATLILLLSPNLLSSLDMNAIRSGGPGIGPATPLPAGAQPGSVFVQATFFNGSAAPNTVNLIPGFCWVRTVKGLEEG